MGENTKRTAVFVELFAKHNQQIYVFVRTLVPNRTDAEEIFQETCKVLWAKFDKFEIGTNFMSWACTIARFEALGFMRKQGRQTKIFSDEFYQVVEEQTVLTSDRFEDQRTALAECYQQLSVNHQELIELAYKRDLAVKEISSILGRSTNAIYKTLKRVHRLLFDCIQNKLSSKG